jgi:branched-chain amino acid transport system permease protein
MSTSLVAAPRDPLRRPVVIALFAAALIAWAFAGPYTIEILTKLAIFVIFALSIDFLVGYTGLVTMGHAGFLGVGAYATAYFGAIHNWPAGLAMVLAVAIGAIVAALIGVFVIRVAGVFFIMVTLAVGMMFNAWASKALLFGRDDGLAGVPRLDLSAIGIDLSNSSVYCLFVIVVAALAYLFFERLVGSPFGQTLKAIRQNENRVRALGCPVARYKLAAFVIAGTVAALAGSLHAQQNNFVNPQIAHWMVSGEGLIYVIVGGMGTLVGPIIGTALYVIMEEIVATFAKQHTLIWMGLFFITIVLIASDGLYGRFAGLWRLLRRPRAANPKLVLGREAGRDA